MLRPARMEGKRAALLVALFVMAAVLAAIPSCSAAVTATMPKKPKASASPPPPSVGTGRRRPSSAVFPLYGDVYPHGTYYATMNIGNPPKPYFMDVDTGSDVTWLQCDAPCQRCSKVPHPLYKPSRLIPCENALCYAVHASTHQKHECESPTQCDYTVQYADHGSSMGVLVADYLALPLIDRSAVRTPIAFGCGYDQMFRNPEQPMPTDGVLGLGFGKAGILYQLSSTGVIHNVMGHCLSRKGGGYLFLGDDLVPPTGITWSPKTRIGDSNYYSPGPASLLWGTQTLASKLPVVLDSGSSYTYLGFQAYQNLLSATRKHLSRQPLKDASDDRSLPLCWKGPRPFRSVLDAKSYFKSLVLSFGNGRKRMEIPPENYLIVTSKGNACLGILNGTEAGLHRDLNVIGDISLQDLVVIYDNEKQQIGWGHANCDRLPNADRIDGFCRPQFASMGILKQQCPAYHHSVTVSSG